MAKYLQNSTDIEINESGDNLQFKMVKTKLLNLIYPVGSIYMSATNTNPGSTLGGTWVAWGSGKVPVGIDSTDTDFNTAEKTGGKKTHTLTINEMPSHNHYLYNATGGSIQFPAYTAKDNGTTGSTATNGYATSTGNTGSSQPHNNLQPYITCYMFKRTA